MQAPALQSSQAHMTGSRSRQFLSLYFDSCYDTRINDLHEVCTMSGHLNYFKTELTLMLLTMLQTEKRLIFIFQNTFKMPLVIETAFALSYIKYSQKRKMQPKLGSNTLSSSNS